MARLSRLRKNRPYTSGLGSGLRRAGKVGGLGRRGRGKGIGGVDEIEELRHVRLGCVAAVEAVKLEALLDELEHRGVIHGRMRDVVGFGEWRNHNERHPKTGARKVTLRIVGMEVSRGTPSGLGTCWAEASAG